MSKQILCLFLLFLFCGGTSLADEREPLGFYRGLLYIDVKSDDIVMVPYFEDFGPAARPDYHILTHKGSGASLELTVFHNEKFSEKDYASDMARVVKSLKSLEFIKDVKSETVTVGGKRWNRIESITEGTPDLRSVSMTTSFYGRKLIVTGEAPALFYSTKALIELLGFDSIKVK